MYSSKNLEKMSKDNLLTEMFNIDTEEKYPYTIDQTVKPTNPAFRFFGVIDADGTEYAVLFRTMKEYNGIAVRRVQIGLKKNKYYKWSNFIVPQSKQKKLLVTMIAIMQDYFAGLGEGNKDSKKTKGFVIPIPEQFDMYKERFIKSTVRALRKYVKAEGVAFAEYAGDSEVTHLMLVKRGYTATNVFKPTGKADPLHIIPASMVDELKRDDEPAESAQQPQKSVASSEKQVGTIEKFYNVEPWNAPITDNELMQMDLEKVKDLGGSTGAKLFKDKLTEEKYVVKKGASTDHAFNEYVALNLFRIGGASVPQAIWDETSDSLLTRFIDNTKPFSYDYIDGLAQGYLLDVLFANWDVVGMELDNVLITQSGTPVRIDVGGALFYRAQGQPKGTAFGDTPNEDVVFPSKKPYNQIELTPEMLSKQIVELSQRFPRMMQYLKTDELVLTYWPETSKILIAKLESRFQVLQVRYGSNVSTTQVDPNEAEPVPADTAKLAADTTAPEHKIGGMVNHQEKSTKIDGLQKAIESFSTKSYATDSYVYGVMKDNMGGIDGLKKILFKETKITGMNEYQRFITGNDILNGLVEKFPGMVQKDQESVSVLFNAFFRAHIFQIQAAAIRLAQEQGYSIFTLNMGNPDPVPYSLVDESGVDFVKNNSSRIFLFKESVGTTTKAPVIEGNPYIETFMKIESQDKFLETFFIQWNNHGEGNDYQEGFRIMSYAELELALTNIDSNLNSQINVSKFEHLVQAVYYVAIYKHHLPFQVVNYEVGHAPENVKTVVENLSVIDQHRYAYFIPKSTLSGETGTAETKSEPLSNEEPTYSYDYYKAKFFEVMKQKTIVEFLDGFFVYEPTYLSDIDASEHGRSMKSVLVLNDHPYTKEFELSAGPFEANLLPALILDFLDEVYNAELRQAYDSTPPYKSAKGNIELIYTNRYAYYLEESYYQKLKSGKVSAVSKEDFVEVDEKQNLLDLYNKITPSLFEWFKGFDKSKNWIPVLLDDMHIPGFGYSMASIDKISEYSGKIAKIIDEHGESEVKSVFPSALLNYLYFERTLQIVNATGVKPYNAVDVGYTYTNRYKYFITEKGRAILDGKKMIEFNPSFFDGDDFFRLRLIITKVDTLNNLEFARAFFDETPVKVGGNDVHLFKYGGNAAIKNYMKLFPESPIEPTVHEMPVAVISSAFNRAFRVFGTKDGQITDKQFEKIAKKMVTEKKYADQYLESYGGKHGIDTVSFYTLGGVHYAEKTILEDEKSSGKQFSSVNDTVNALKKHLETLHLPTLVKNQFTIEVIQYPFFTGGKTTIHDYVSLFTLHEFVTKNTEFTSATGPEVAIAVTAYLVENGVRMYQLHSNEGKLSHVSLSYLESVVNSHEFDTGTFEAYELVMEDEDYQAIVDGKFKFVNANDKVVASSETTSDSIPFVYNIIGVDLDDDQKVRIGNVQKYLQNKPIKGIVEANFDYASKSNGSHEIAFPHTVLRNMVDMLNNEPKFLTFGESLFLLVNEIYNYGHVIMHEDDTLSALQAGGVIENSFTMPGMVRVFTPGKDGGIADQDGTPVDVGQISDVLGPFFKFGLPNAAYNALTVGKSKEPVVHKPTSTATQTTDDSTLLKVDMPADSKTRIQKALKGLENKTIMEIVQSCFDSYPSQNSFGPLHETVYPTTIWDTILTGDTSNQLSIGEAMYCVADILYKAGLKLSYKPNLDLSKKAISQVLEGFMKKHTKLYKIANNAIVDVENEQLMDSTDYGKFNQELYSFGLSKTQYDKAMGMEIPINSLKFSSKGMKKLTPKPPNQEPEEGDTTWGEKFGKSLPLEKAKDHEIVSFDDRQLEHSIKAVINGIELNVNFTESAVDVLKKAEGIKRVIERKIGKGLIDHTEARNIVRAMIKAVDENNIKNINQIKKKYNVALKYDVDAEIVSAVSSYSGSGYSDLNAALRHKLASQPGFLDGSDVERLEKMVKRLNRGFEKHGIRFPADHTLYRAQGVNEEHIDALEMGGTFLMDGYSSCSSSIAASWDGFMKTSPYIQDHIYGAAFRNDGWNAGVQTRLDHKMFMSISRLDRTLALVIEDVSKFFGEREVLLNRDTVVRLKPGTRFEVVSHDNSNNKNNYIGDFEVVGDGGLVESLRLFEQYNELSVEQKRVLFVAKMSDIADSFDMADELDLSIEGVENWDEYVRESRLIQNLIIPPNIQF